MKEAAYKGLVRPVLEYGSLLKCKGLYEGLDTVQNRVARFMVWSVLAVLVSEFR